MGISVLEDAGTVTISLGSDFVFSEHRSFLDAYRQRPLGTQYVIDFRNVGYMDSSAFGMLLMIREHNGAGNKSLIKLINCNQQIMKLIDVAQFPRLFMVR